MRNAPSLLALFLLAAICGSAQQQNLANWTKLVDAKKCEQATKLCTGFVNSSKISEKVDAQKCLANVALCGHESLQVQANDTGGARIGGGYSTDAVDEAIKHLNLGLNLAPQDLSIHKGRLHILESSGRYSEMIKALDDSCSLYKGKDVPREWLPYAAELMDRRQYQAGLDFMKVLDKHYPNSPDVLGNIGAFLSLLTRDSEAIAYLKNAAELAPNDPINAWDLGRAYDSTGNIELADTWYKKGLALQTDEKQRAASNCIYSKFLDQKLHQRELACAIQTKDCGEKDRSACAPGPASAKQDK
jgi:tetratricopeptide (TPR) repeat protein